MASCPTFDEGVMTFFNVNEDATYAAFLNFFNTNQLAWIL